jgi:hypothetical protein
VSIVKVDIDPKLMSEDGYLKAMEKNLNIKRCLLGLQIICFVK